MSHLQSNMRRRLLFFNFFGLRLQPGMVFSGYVQTNQMNCIKSSIKCTNYCTRKMWLKSTVFLSIVFWIFTKLCLYGIMQPVLNSRRYLLVFTIGKLPVHTCLYLLPYVPVVLCTLCPSPLICVSIVYIQITI